MSLFWGVWVFLVFLNIRVTGLLFKAYPRRIQLNGHNISQWLSLSCSLNDTDDVRDVYVIEIGRSFHSKYFPIAQVRAADGGKVAVLLDRPNVNRTVTHGSIEATDLTLSHLHVRLTGLRCEDVTSHYCLVYYVTSSQNGIQEDRSEQVVKAAGVTLETAPNFFNVDDPVNTTVTLHCTFFMRGANLYYLAIGRKTATSRTVLVVANTTNTQVVDTAVAPRLKADSVINGNYATESWLTAVLSPVVCEDIAEYYCGAVYVVRNVTTRSDDVADVKGSCGGVGDRGMTVKSTTMDLHPVNSIKELSTHPTRQSGVTGKFSTTPQTDTIDIGDASEGSRTEPYLPALLTIVTAISVNTWRTY